MVSDQLIGSVFTQVYVHRLLPSPALVSGRVDPKAFRNFDFLRIFASFKSSSESEHLHVSCLQKHLKRTMSLVTYGSDGLVSSMHRHVHHHAARHSCESATCHRVTPLSNWILHNSNLNNPYLAHPHCCRSPSLINDINILIEFDWARLLPCFPCRLSSLVIPKILFTPSYNPWSFLPWTNMVCT